MISIQRAKCYFRLDSIDKYVSNLPSKRVCERYLHSSSPVSVVWNVYGECENIMALTGHSGAVMQALFNTDGSQIHSCSTDKTLAIWDMTTGTRVRRMKGHTNFVNSLSNNRRGVQMLCSGSDDRTVRLWDGRKKAPAATMEAQYQVTAVTFNDTAEQIISSGIDNVIKLWDLRKNRIVNTLQGHTDTVTGLSLSPDGSHVLSNSMDNSLRMWDVRPYVPGERCVKVFQGHQHNFEKNLLRCAWSKDGDLVAAGSGDRFVYIWEVLPRRILYKLPGHDGGVNDVAFSPIEPLILSASSDKTLYLGELDY